jgi:hypothetical protein
MMGALSVYTGDFYHSNFLSGQHTRARRFDQLAGYNRVYILVFILGHHSDITRSGLSTTEASRAIRKKLKHGNNHQQYRALVVC